MPTSAFRQEAEEMSPDTARDTLILRAGQAEAAARIISFCAPTGAVATVIHHLFDADQEGANWHEGRDPFAFPGSPLGTLCH